MTRRHTRDYHPPPHSRVPSRECPPHAQVLEGCLLFREEKFEEAQRVFEGASPSFDPQQAYNAALCCYRLKRYGDALKGVAKVIEHGIREHPELGAGSYLEDTGEWRVQQSG